MRALITVSCALLFSAFAQAHPGGLNAEGCHNNRKTGEYHCHRGRSTPQPVFNEPRRAVPPNGGAFRNCSEARMSGAAPVRAGVPGYGRHLDRDGDGIGCE
ncbi:MAG: excalibur calcium-binding domain-containing protein [Sphingomonadales bacterium]